MIFWFFFTLQLTKAIITQWPFNCIKTYESTGRGQFGLDIGKLSQSGDGLFVFNTRLGQDNHIYDLLDKYIMEQAHIRMVFLLIFYSVYKQHTTNLYTWYRMNKYNMVITIPVYPNTRCHPLLYHLVLSATLKIPN